VATHRKTEKERQLDDGRVGGGVRGWARSPIIGPQESLVLYKSFNTFCSSCTVILKKTLLCSDEGYEYVLELYDLKADPTEKVSLAESPTHRDQLIQLQAWARELALQMVRSCQPPDGKELPTSRW
jgi:hypothetical protein